MGRVLSERVTGDLGEVFDRLRSSLYPKRRVTTGLPTIHPSAHDCLARPPSKTSQEPDVVMRLAWCWYSLHRLGDGYSEMIEPNFPLLETV
jgi:hypothetical protein